MRIIPYIKFLFTSTNAHGVHSPFVFKLVTECFYDKNKQTTLLHRIIKYFNPEIVYISGKDIDAEKKLISNLALTTDNQQPSAHFAYISHKKQTATLKTFEQLLPSITVNTILIYNHIHASTQMEEAWAVIKNHQKVTVTIDTFTHGLVFFRNEQQKEHFTIRPSKSPVADFVLGIPKLWGMLH